MRSPISAISSIRWVMKIDADALAAEPADDREQAVARRDVERRGRLVEDQDPRLAQERAHDAARLAVAERELLDRRAERRAGARAARRAPARARARFSRGGTRVRHVPSIAEPDVVEHRPRLGDEDLLEDGDDAVRPARRAGCGRGASLAVEADRRRQSGAWTPLRILTSVLLPEPFSPTSACTSPGAQLERAVAQRLRRAEGLRHLSDLDEQRRGIARLRRRFVGGGHDAVHALATPALAKAAGSRLREAPWPSPCHLSSPDELPQRNGTATPNDIANAKCHIAIRSVAEKGGRRPRRGVATDVHRAP